MATSNTTLSLEIIESNGKLHFYFTIKIAKTEFLVSLRGTELFIQKLRAGRLIPGGQYFQGVDSAAQHYKNKNMQAALQAIPEYIANGKTGEITI